LAQLVFVAHFSARSRRDSANLMFQEHVPSPARLPAGGHAHRTTDRPFLAVNRASVGPIWGNWFVAHFSARSRRDSADLLFQEHWRLTRG
jgi:hypothetical protein